MDVLRIRPFVVATDRVFRKLLGARARLGKPTANRELSATGASVALEVAAGSESSFVIVLQFDPGMAHAVAEALPGDEVADHAEAKALQEFARLMIAAAKRGGALHDASVSLTGVAGGSPPWLVFPFESDIGRLQLAVSAAGRKPAPVVRAGGATN